VTQVFNHPWLGALFQDEEISALWSAQTQLAHYKRFEAALAEALEACGRVPFGQGTAAAKAIAAAEIDYSSLASGTASDGLPIPDLIRQLRNAAQPNEAAVHTGATSQDVLDTALSLTLRALTDVLIVRLEAVDGLLADLGVAHGNAPLMGRTRMQAALPIRVSDRIATWRQPLQEHAAALRTLRRSTERLQLGGSVGTRGEFGEDSGQIAHRMAAAMGLEAAPVWHTKRAAIVDYANRLSLISGALGKFGQDAALMAQTGIDEIVLAGGGTSSAMPHKSNPIKPELLVTLARFNSVQVAGMHQALVHEQERSGAAWMLEWMLLPQMACTAGRSLLVASELCADILRIGGPSARPSVGEP